MVIDCPFDLWISVRPIMVNVQVQMYIFCKQLPNGCEKIELVAWFYCTPSDDKSSFQPGKLRSLYTFFSDILQQRTDMLHNAYIIPYNGVGLVIRIQKVICVKKEKIFFTTSFLSYILVRFHKAYVHIQGMS